MPASVVPRLLSITYGGFVMGGASEYHLHNVHLTDENYDAGSIEFDLVIASTTTELWADLVTAFKIAMRKPNQTLSVVMNGESEVAVDPATNTGFLARPKWKLLASHRTKKTCAYRVSISWVNPADFEPSTRKYRREASVTLRTSDVGLRTMSVRAVYTAGGTGAGSSAFEHATTDFAAYTAQLKLNLGGSWDEAAPNEVTTDDEDKIATAIAGFQEVAVPEVAAGDDAGLVSVTYFVTTQRSQSEATAGEPASSPTILTVDFSAGVKLTASTDPEAYARDRVLTYFRDLIDQHGDAGGGSPFLVDENVRVDVRGNRVSGRLQYLAFATTLVRSSLSLAESIRSGLSLVPVLNGNPWARDKHNGAGMWRRVVQLETRELVSGPAGPHDVSQQPFNTAVESAIAEGFHLLSDESPLVRDFETRLAGGAASLTFRDRVRRATLEYGEIEDEVGDTRVRGRTESR